VPLSRARVTRWLVAGWELNERACAAFAGASVAIYRVLIETGH
jgi:hypothetical protein